MNCIYAITRGYQNTYDYNKLIKRNLAIKEHIRDKYEYLILMILFHEGNISLEHQQYIIKESKQNIQFIDVSHCWDAKHGYESMCRFNIYHSWIELHKLGFKYALRIDEDCVVQECNSNPFLFNTDQYVYSKSVYWGESHSETNATLPQYIETLTGVNRDIFYNNKFPYTNVGLANVEFFIEHQDILKQIGINDMQTINRWGDLPVIGSILNIYAIDKVTTLQNFKYYHESHNFNIECK